MLNIDSITRGLVIDHIQVGSGLTIFKYLELEKADFTVALIMNAPSRKHGRKDLIKVENKIDIDFDMLGFIDPNITVNIIEDEEIVEKINLSLPKKVKGIIQCQNPRCVTSTERNIVHKFILIDEEYGTYKCEYCDQIYSWEG